MADDTETQNALLLEAQRTTHAVRAIGQFLIIQSTYFVMAAIGIGLALANGAGSVGGLLLFGAVIAVFVGLLHSITAARHELNKSDRLKA